MPRKSQKFLREKKQRLLQKQLTGYLLRLFHQVSKRQMEVGLYYEGCSLRFWIRSEMTGEVGWSWQVSPAVFSA